MDKLVSGVCWLILCPLDWARKVQINADEALFLAECVSEDVSGRNQHLNW